MLESADVYTGPKNIVLAHPVRIGITGSLASGWIFFDLLQLFVSPFSLVPEPHCTGIWELSEIPMSSEPRSLGASYTMGYCHHSQ